HKMRVYEMTDHPTAREMIGYLLVRGTTHALAYAKALEIATGVDVPNMLPIPAVDNRKFDTARKFEERGLGNILYTWNDEGAYNQMRRIWKGENPTSGEQLVVVDGIPEGGPIPDLDALPEEFAPGIGPDHFEYVYRRLMANM